MAIHIQSIDEFLILARTYPVFDVRSPGEYQHAHIPGALSLPLFSDEERVRIGTSYKKDSREAAIKIGLDAFGPKMRSLVESVESILSTKKDNSRTVLVHCWRGGMRSGAVAWLLSFYGFDVHLLSGGYKAYRHWVIQHWQQSRKFRIIAGFTGSGKTDVLEALKNTGAPTFNLEALAGHRGSAFGGLDKIPQPSQEMFENKLATALDELSQKFGDLPVWIENESQRIGNLNIPHDFFLTWNKAPVCFLDIPFETRLNRIVQEYGKYPVEDLINSIVRIKKRLGPLETKTAIAFLVEGNLHEAFGILLNYYDKLYKKPSGPGSIIFEGSEMQPNQIAEAIQHYFL